MLKVYSKANCSQCESAKKLLKEWDIEFEEVRIDIDSDARDFLLGEGHRSVPQLYVGNGLLVEGGFAGLRTLSPSYIKGRIESEQDRT